MHCNASLPPEGRLSCFRFGAIRNKSATNIDVQVFVWTLSFRVSQVNAKARGCRIKWWGCVLLCKKLPTCLPKWVVPSCISTSPERVSLAVRTCSPASELIYLSLLDLGHFDFNSCVWYLIVVLICSWLIRMILAIFSDAFFASLFIFFWEVSVLIFCPFLNGVVHLLSHCWVIRFLAYFGYMFFIRYAFYK